MEEEAPAAAEEAPAATLGRIESVRSGQDGVESWDLGEDGCRGLGLLTAMVVMEAVLFGLFTMCMLCDQTAMLTTNETKIDRLKGGASVSAPDAKVRSSLVSLPADNCAFASETSRNRPADAFFLPPRVLLFCPLFLTCCRQKCKLLFHLFKK